MFEAIRGQLTEVSPLRAIIETAGIRYRIHIPLNVYSDLCGKPSETLLFLSQVIREDSHRLFGFLDKDQRDLFESICEISGIGPKTALLIVGHIGMGELALAVSQEDSKTLCRIPGIGKKTAERLILEMKHLFKKSPILLPADGTNHLLSDALAALVNLGYQENHASKAIRKAMDKGPLSLPELIAQTLKII